MQVEFSARNFVGSRAEEKGLGKTASRKAQLLFRARNLFHEERFAELVAAHKRFDGPESSEEVLYFAVLVNALRGARGGSADHLQRIRIGNPVTLKTFRFLAVEHGKNNSARTQNFRKAGHCLLGNRGL